MHEQVDDRLNFYETGEAPMKNEDAMMEVIEELKTIETESQEPSSEKKKKKKKKSKAADEKDENDEPAKEVCFFFGFSFYSARTLMVSERPICTFKSDRNGKHILPQSITSLK